MVWRCFSSASVGPIYLITDVMIADIYINVLEKIILPYAEDNMPLLLVNQQDNNLKHTVSKAKRCSQHNDIRQLDWPKKSTKKICGRL